MPGIFGFFDPSQRLSGLILDDMARALGALPGCFATERTAMGGFGVANYAGAELIGGRLASRYAVFGQLDAMHADDISTTHAAIAKQCFGEDGVKSVEHIRGSFVAVVSNLGDGSLTLITDRFATQPLYLCWHEEICYFASQLKAILAVVPIPAEIDRQSVATMLSIGEVVGNRTLIAGIQTLPAATCLTLSKQGRQYRQYWQYIYDESLDSDWQSSVERVGQALNTAVARNVRNASSLVVPLSGGLDSRFVLDLACQNEVKPTAYTWGTEGCRDIRYAQDIARRLECHHEAKIFKADYLASMADRGVWLTEGQTPATNFHVIPYVDMLVSRGHDLLLDGFAGDVVLGGNFIADAWLDSNDLDDAAGAIWNWRRKGFDSGWQPEGLGEIRGGAKTVFMESYSGYLGRTPMDKAMAFLIDNRLRRTTNCGTEIFRSRLKTRQPFMDADFMESISVLPHRWRKRHRFYLDVMKRFAPLSAGAPYQRTMLPASLPYWANWFSLAGQRGVAEAAKRFGLPDPFPGKSPSDFPAWFRGGLQPYVRNVLLSERTLDRGVIPADVIRETINQHMENKRDMSSLIGTMLSLELFCRLFFDDFKNSVPKFNKLAVGFVAG